MKTNFSVQENLRLRKSNNIMTMYINALIARYKTVENYSFIAGIRKI